MALTLEASTSEQGHDKCNGVRLIVLNLPEDEGEGIGFRLTRTLWDPYPWVREVVPGSRADLAGLKTGDCLLHVDGKDLLGLPIGQVAGLIRGDGAGRGVSLVVWNCGVDPSDDPELLWSCGGGARGERARRALSGAVRALQCCVCGATATQPHCCPRSHLYCLACWRRLDRCALCRENLPDKDSPYARNLVAEQVFEAIATEYEIKNVKKQQGISSSANTTPNRSPNISPAVQRRGQYQLSMMTRKKVQFTEKYASDPNIHRTTQKSTNSDNHRNTEYAGNSVESNANSTNLICNTKATNSVENTVSNKQELTAGNIACSCRESKMADGCDLSQKGAYDFLQHKLVARLRQSCSLADLQNAVPIGSLSQSATCLGGKCHEQGHHASLDNLKIHDTPVILLPSPPIYVVTCDHNKNDTRS